MAPAAQALANYFAGAIQAGAQGAPGRRRRRRTRMSPSGCAATSTQHCQTFDCSLHCATEITPCINTHANTCYLPRHAWLPDAKPALPVAGPMHLYRLRSYACLYVRIAVRCGRLPPPQRPQAAPRMHVQMRDGNHALHQHRRERLLSVRSPHGCPTQIALPSHAMHWIGCWHTLACTYGLLYARPHPPPPP